MTVSAERGRPPLAGGYGLYIHVPFCGSICSYCHFARTDRHDAARRAAYVDALVRECELRRLACATLRDGRRQLRTAYLGGGTPSCLEPELMERLLQGTVGTLAAAADLELTAEANPESLEPDKMAAWAGAGINRLSLGVQSLDPDVLRQLGRRCDPETALAALAGAGKHFARVSADWIIGPGATLAGLQGELDRALDLGVTHFSLYILELHAGTELERRVRDGQVKLLPDSRTETLYLGVGEHLARRGVVQYEVANFARPGHESRHNQAYWSGRPWLALGPSAHGYWGRRRQANHAGLDRWEQEVKAGRLPVAEVDLLDRRARRLERVILALRTAAGVPLEWLPAAALDLDLGRAEGLWNLREGRLVLTPRGFLRIDTLEEKLARSL